VIIEDPLILWTIIGVVSGIILGISGAGGGMIVTPILIHLGGYDIKDATAYSLWALTYGSAFSWFIQRHNTNYGMVLALTSAAIVMAALMAPIKQAVSPVVIALLLTTTCLFSLYSLWFYKPREVQPDEKRSYVRSAAGGALAGGLSTLTGIGGGVVMVPWLLSVGKLKMREATASSLMVIALTAPFSIWVQGRHDIGGNQLTALFFGVVLSSLSIQYLLQHTPKEALNILRKVTLTVAIVAAITGALTSVL